MRITLKMKHNRRPPYVINPSSLVYLFHWFVIKLEIQVIIIYISFESAYEETFSSTINAIFTVNWLDIILTAFTGVLNRENQVDYKLFLYGNTI